MKANYSKPLLAVEMFAMTQNTARDCADFIHKEDVHFNEIEHCYWDMGGGARVFIAEPTCNINGETSGIACYNNPSEGNYIFRS